MIHIITYANGLSQNTLLASTWLTRHQHCGSDSRLQRWTDLLFTSNSCRASAQRINLELFGAESVRNDNGLWFENNVTRFAKNTMFEFI